jgi:hypothetical protein
MRRHDWLSVGTRKMHGLETKFYELRRCRKIILSFRELPTVCDAITLDSSYLARLVRLRGPGHVVVNR